MEMYYPNEIYIMDARQIWCNLRLISSKFIKYMLLLIQCMQMRQKLRFAIFKTVILEPWLSHIGKNNQ